MNQPENMTLQATLQSGASNSTTSLRQKLEWPGRRHPFGDHVDTMAVRGRLLFGEVPDGDLLPRGSWTALV